jgi:ribonucleoside-diphosphate reductase alpha chain
MVQKKLEGLGLQIFEQRYSYPGEKDYSDRARTMARHVASCENDDVKEKWFDRFYEALNTGDLVPGGRIIFGAGRVRQNLLNCYAIEPEDTVESIGKTIQDMYRISCGGGGIGFNFSKIRPRGDDISNIKNSAPGAVSVMKMINEIGSSVKAGKSRRTALMSELNVDHPDLLEFLHVKLDRNELTNFNISVAITDKFIKACEENSEWAFSFANRDYYVYQCERVSPNGDKQVINIVALSEEDAVNRGRQHHLNHPDDQFLNIEKVNLKAMDLWNRLWANAVESGEPGIFNLSLTNRFTNVSYFLKMNQTNPCGEIPLESYANCCLGHINLVNMLTEDNKEIDWRRLARTIRASVRFLDNVLTVNHYPIQECKIAGERSRRVGLGTMGLHHMLIKLGIKYGSDKCLEFLDRLYATIRNEAYLASMYIAQEKGSFPEFDAKKFLDEEFARELPARIRMLIRENGIRNALLLTAAPTGTISMVHNTSTGIEPIFAPIYKRRYREGNTWRETLVLDPLFKEALEKGQDASHIVGAYDVTPEQHMGVQAVIQRYIDNSISKTINLPGDANKDPDKIAKMALKFAPYLKGITVYRAGSRGQEPLEAVPLTPETIQMAKELIAKERVESNQAVEVCRIGGECGS